MQTTRELKAKHVPSVEAVVSDRDHLQLLWLMTEYFRTVGFTDIRARLPGHVPPPLLSGTVEDTRPDCTCRQTDSGQTPIIMEVVTPEDLKDPLCENRWALLGSAARLYGAELHFVVPRWSERGAVDEPLRRRLHRMELVPNHVWKV